MLRSLISIRMVEKITLVTVLSATFAFSHAVSAQENESTAEKPAKKAKKDIKPLSAKEAKNFLQGAINPYVPGKERAKFLRAAGVDTELTLKELEANREDKESFIRKYDNIKNITQFDRDKNKKINWFEADAYRRALRAAVVKTYDKNKNNKLNGEEVVTAANALNAGNVPNVKAMTAMLLVVVIAVLLLLSSLLLLGSLFSTFLRLWLGSSFCKEEEDGSLFVLLFRPDKNGCNCV